MNPKVIARYACLTFDCGSGLAFNSIRQKWRWHYRSIRLAIRAGVLCLILAPTLALHAAIDENRLADAIYVAEGGKAAKSPYGVLSVKVSGEAEARRVCLNSIRNNKRRFGAVSDAEFINRMADRWCPKSADPKGNANWRRNVAFFYFKK